MRWLWEKMTENVWEEAQQMGVQLGYMVGKQEAVDYLDSLIASGDYDDYEDLLETIIEELQNSHE
jgi:hypothetical protein|tara:strand:+ start:808 stop:1002 length:195 start_codon:yes stop_codon:yes gene_type:complete